MLFNEVHEMKLTTFLSFLIRLMLLFPRYPAGITKLPEEETLKTIASPGFITKSNEGGDTPTI